MHGQDVVLQLDESEFLKPLLRQREVKEAQALSSMVLAVSVSSCGRADDLGMRTLVLREVLFPSLEGCSGMISPYEYCSILFCHQHSYQHNLIKCSKRNNHCMCAAQSVSFLTCLSLWDNCSIAYKKLVIA